MVADDRKLRFGFGLNTHEEDIWSSRGAEFDERDLSAILDHIDRGDTLHLSDLNIVGAPGAPYHRN